MSEPIICNGCGARLTVPDDYAQQNAMFRVRRHLRDSAQGGLQEESRGRSTS